MSDKNNDKPKKIEIIDSTRPSLLKKTDKINIDDNKNSVKIYDRVSKIIKRQEKKTEILKKLYENENWDKIHEESCDWSIFPIDQPSNFNSKYMLTKADIVTLNKNNKFIKNLRRIILIVTASWGWDVKKKTQIKTNNTGHQTFFNRASQLYDAGLCCMIFRQTDLFEGILHYFNWLKTDNKYELTYQNMDIMELWKKDIARCMKIYDDSEIRSSDKKNSTPLRSDDKDIVIGIDLGTCNSCVSIWRNGKCEIISDEHNFSTVPSVVSIYKGQLYIGNEAKNQSIQNPQNTFYGVKRYIGLKYDDPLVKYDLSRVPYKIECDEKNNIYLVDSTNDKLRWTPEQISAMILMRLKNMAIAYLNKPITKAVVTVPAYFTDNQRQATKDACTIAGLNCIHLLNEPTAGALAYGFNKRNKKNINIIVYDLGGGTLDAVLLNINKGMFRVIQSSGNTHLGGEDFDNKIMDYCINHFCKKNADILDSNIYESKDNNKNNTSQPIINQKVFNPVSLQSLKKACETAKKMLSNIDCKSTTIFIKDFYKKKDLILEIDRVLFEKICEDLFYSCFRFVLRLMKISNMSPDDIDEVILVGGSTRIPRIKNDLKRYFCGSTTVTNGKAVKKNKINNVNPDTIVSTGAAIKGYIMLNPDDPYASEVVLTDSIPLSLGIEIMGGQFAKIIPRGTIIPTKKTKRFTTDTDNMKSVTINVYEGERKNVNDNFKLGQFKLTDIVAAPRGIPQIEITISIDNNNITSVTAIDKRKFSTKKTLKINENRGRLSKTQIKQMIEDAKIYDMRDKVHSEKTRLMYEIKEMCKTIIENIEDKAFNLSKTDKIDINNDTEDILKWLKNNPNKNMVEYKDVSTKIKKKYASLILKVYKSDTKITASSLNGSTAGTTVYNDNNLNSSEAEEEQTVFEKLENEDIIYGLTDSQKQETLNMRETLTELCNTIRESLNSSFVNINNIEKKNINDIVDNTVMWIHVIERATVAEYSNKLIELNKLCNDITSKHDTIFKDDVEIKELSDSRSKLEQLTYSLKIGLDKKIIHLEPPILRKGLQIMVEDTIQWLLDNKNMTDMSKYNEKIERLQLFSKELYNKMTDKRIGTGTIIKKNNKTKKDVNRIDTNNKINELNILDSEIDYIG